jgi:hypothetical protein
MHDLKGEYDLAKSHTGGDEPLVFALMKTWDSPPEPDIGTCKSIENSKWYHYAYTRGSITPVGQQEFNIHTIPCV